jgi:hypothetical protein
VNENRTITEARITIRRGQPSPGPARNSVSVMAPASLLAGISRGATHSQLIRKPDTVAGNSHRAGHPHRYAMPLTDSSVHAEEEDAEALMAATQAPSRRPPRKKSLLSRVRRAAHRPMATRTSL